MKSVILTDEDVFGFAPPCAAYLGSPHLKTYHEEKETGHPLAIFNHAWSAVREQFVAVLDTLSSIKPDTSDPTSLLRAQANLYYRSAELVDVLTGEIAKSLSPGKRYADIGGPDGLRTALMKPCNKLKHNAHRMSMTRSTFNGVSVFGFMLMHLRKGALLANPEFHARRDSFSFNVELRRIFADIYLYCAGVQRKLESLGVKAERREPDSSDIALIKRISDLPIFCWFDEGEKEMPFIEFNGKRLEIRSTGGLTLPLSQIGSSFATVFIGDGVTRTFGFKGRED